MKVLKLKRRIEIDKTIGNFHIETFHYSGKGKHWTELHCWYECDCECCPLSWEDMGYDGECYNFGCYMAEHGNDCPKTLIICMLPNWMKKILLRHKTRK